MFTNKLGYIEVENFEQISQDAFKVLDHNLKKGLRINVTIKQRWCDAI